MSNLSKPISACENESAGLLAPERLDGDELNQFLSKFLCKIDYDTMGTFFLTYRRYLSSLELFKSVSNAYSDSYYDRDDALSRANRIRIFVSLRHWLLNYFLNDFLPSHELQSTVVHFLEGLGGVGADEISTEARIAKELRKTWDRQLDLYGSKLTSEGQIQAQEAWFLINRHITFTSDTRLSTLDGMLRPQTLLRASEDAAHEREILSYRHISNKQLSGSPVQYNELRSIILDDKPCGGISSETTVDTNTGVLPVDEPEKSSSVVLTTSSARDLELEPRTDALDQPSRALRRRPGGILKNVKTVAEVVANNRFPITSAEYSFPEKKFNRLNAAFSLRLTHRPRLSIQKVVTQDLARIFRDDHCDESQEDTAVVLAKTMDKLEGRDKSEDIDQYIPDCAKCDSKEDSYRTLEGEGNDGEDHTISPDSRKRKRHGGCLDESRTSQRKNKISGQEAELLSIAETSLAGSHQEVPNNASSAHEPPSLFREKLMEKSEDRDASHNEEVSLVEALGIAPLPESLPQNTTTESSSYCSWITQHNPALISKLLLKIEEATFRDLDWLELTCGNWTHHLVNHIQDWHEVVAIGWRSIAFILARGILTSAWVVSEILHTTRDTDRVKVMTAFIDIAGLCRDHHNNFAALVQIVRGLQHPTIKRLSKTWASLPQDTRRTWSRLSPLCDPHDRQVVLRTVQERVLLNPDASVVPYLAPYLDHVEQVNASRTMTITDKMQSVAKTTKVLMGMMDRVTNVSVEQDQDEEKVDYTLLDRLVWIRGVDDDQAMKLSMLCEG